MADYQTIEFIQSLIKDVLERMGVSARVDYEDSLVSGLVFNIRTRDAKLLIGHQGTTLHALEHIIHSMVSRQLAAKQSETDNRVFFSVDIDDYKRNRQYQIKQMIKEQVSEMRRSGKPGSLPPMPKYERKFAHMYIQEQFPHVATESLGEEPNRYIKLLVE